MATNITRYLNTHSAFPVVVSHPATPVSGNPVRFGKATGVALTDEGEGGNLATETTVDFGHFVGNFSVHGETTVAAAIAVGDRIYYDDAGTATLNADATNGVFFGIALAAVASGVTATIAVMHLPVGA